VEARAFAVLGSLWCGVVVLYCQRVGRVGLECVSVRICWPGSVLVCDGVSVIR